MIHPEPIQLGDSLRCFVEMVPEQINTALKPLVADPSRPLESVRLRFYRGASPVGVVAWTDLFTAADCDIAAGDSSRERLADGTALRPEQLGRINDDAWLICSRYGYDSFIRYAPILA